MRRSQLLDYLLVFGAAAVGTFAATPIARSWAIRIGAVVHPDSRRVHKRPTPTLGGTALFYGMLGALLVAALRPGLRAALTSSSEIWGVLFGAAVILGVGTLDDLRDVSPPARVAGEALAGSILSLFGVTMLYFRLWPTDHFVSLGAGAGDLSSLITVIWVIGMANAINLIDGLDGLAAGIVAIAAGSIFLFVFGFAGSGLLSEGSIGPLVITITAGICIGFLPWNFHPAKIFMGDGGAYLLGFLMAASTIVIGGRSPDLFPGKTFFFFGPILIPVVILGIPLADMIFSIFRRVKSGKKWSTGDKEHIHHRLLRMGHGHRRAVLILYAWSVILSAIVLIPAFTGKGNFIVLVAVIAAALGLFTYFAAQRDENGNGRDTLADDSSEGADEERVKQVIGPSLEPDAHGMRK